MEPFTSSFEAELVLHLVSKYEFNGYLSTVTSGLDSGILSNRTKPTRTGLGDRTSPVHFGHNSVEIYCRTLAGETLNGHKLS